MIQIFYTDDSDNTDDDVDEKTFHCLCSWAHSTLAAGISGLMVMTVDNDSTDDDDDVCVVGRMVKYTGYGNCSGLLMMTQMMMAMMMMFV